MSLHKGLVDYFTQERNGLLNDSILNIIYGASDQSEYLSAAHEVAEENGIAEAFDNAWASYLERKQRGESTNKALSEKEISQIIGDGGKSSKTIIPRKTNQCEEAPPISFEEIQKKINAYTIGTYDTGEPYDLIASIRDETLRSRAKYAARAKAKEVGFSLKGFDDICKSRLSELKRQNAEEAERRKNEQNAQAIKDAGESNLSELAGLFDGIVPDIGDYICSKQGIFYFGMYGMINVCSHPLFPTRRSINIETGSELIDLSYKIDNQWKTARLIDRKTISQKNLIPVLSQYGMDITSENAKEVVKYLAKVDNLNRSIIPRNGTVSRLGWIPDRGFSPYIPDVMYDSGGKFSDIYSSIHEYGSFDEWKRIAGMIMGNKRYIEARIVLAASVASVMLPWTCNQSFIVHHWSTISGSGKSVASMLGASVWGKPTVGDFMRPMNSTYVAFEQTAAFCNNLPMFLDELESARIDPDKLIYAHCEGSGKGRGTKDGGLREQTKWLNIAITNGEHPLTSSNKEGLYNRVINIESHGQVIPGDMSSFADTVRENYGFAGKTIVEWLHNKNEHMQLIKEHYKRTANDLMKDATSKQANYGAALLIGDIFLDMLVFDGEYKDNLLTKDDILPFLQTPGMVDVNIKIRSWLCGFVVSEDQHFYHRGRVPIDDIRTTIYGQKEVDGSILIINEVLREELQRRNWNYSSFLRWCDERGLISTKYSASSRHWDVGATISSSSVRVIHFLPAMFADDDHPITEQTTIPL